MLLTDSLAGICFAGVEVKLDGACLVFTVHWTFGHLNRLSYGLIIHSSENAGLAAIANVLFSNVQLRDRASCRFSERSKCNKNCCAAGKYLY